MADSRRIRVSIGNSEYTLRGEASEAHLRQVARKVNDMMGELLAANPRLDDRRAAVLTAINLADELFRTLEERDAWQAQYRELLAHVGIQTQRARPSS